MGFDLASARPVEPPAPPQPAAGFDLNTAQPAGAAPAPRAAGLAPPRTGAAAVPTAEEAATGVYTPPPAAPARPEPTVKDRVIGAAEAGLELLAQFTGGGLGLVAGTVEGIGGQILSGTIGTDAGAQQSAQLAAKRAEQGTQLARRGLQMNPITGPLAAQTALGGGGLGEQMSPAGQEMIEGAQGVINQLPAAGGVYGSLQGPGMMAAGGMRPMVAKGLEGPARAVRQVADAVIDRLPARAEPQPTAGTKGSAGAAGVDMATQRRERAADLPAPIKLTKGQAERTFEQQRFEKETAKDPEAGKPLRERMADQTEAVTKNFEAFVEATGATETDPKNLGRRVVDPLVEKAEKAKKEIREAYDAADAAGETAEPVDYSPVRAYLDEQTPTAKDKLAPILKMAEEQLAKNDPTDTGMVSIKALEDVRKAIRANTEWGTPNAVHATELIRRIDQATEGAGGDLYKGARKLYRDYAAEFKNKGVIRDLIALKKGTSDRKVAFEDVFDRSVLRGSLDDLKNVRETLVSAGPKGEQAWKDMRGTAVEHIKREVFSNDARDERGNKVPSSAKFGRVVEKLDADGKLDYLFGKQGAQQLRDLRDITADIYTAPPGAVNTSNTASVVLAAIDAMISGTSGVPAPILTTLRYTRQKLKDRKVNKGVREALEGDNLPPQPGKAEAFAKDGAEPPAAAAPRETPPPSPPAAAAAPRAPKSPQPGLFDGPAAGATKRERELLRLREQTTDPDVIKDLDAEIAKERKAETARKKGEEYLRLADSTDDPELRRRLEKKAAELGAKREKIPAGKARELSEEEARALTPEPAVEPRQPMGDGVEVAEVTPEVVDAVDAFLADAQRAAQWQRDMRLGDLDAKLAHNTARALQINPEATARAQQQFERSPRAYEREIQRIIDEGEARASQAKQDSGGGQGAARAAGEGDAGRAEADRVSAGQGQPRPDGDAAAAADQARPLRTGRQDGELTEEAPGEEPRKPGEPFIVFRAANDSDRTLANRNAATSDYVADFLQRLDDYDRPQAAGSQNTDTVHVYVASSPKEFGQYERAGLGRKLNADTIGRAAERGGVAYSFPEGFKGKRIASIPIEEFRQLVFQDVDPKETFGSTSFDMLGGKKIGERLREWAGRELAKAQAAGALDQAPVVKRAAGPQRLAKIEEAAKLAAEGVPRNVIDEAVQLLREYDAAPPMEVPPSARKRIEGVLQPLIERAERANGAFSDKVRNLAKQLRGEAKTAPVKSVGRAVEKLYADELETGRWAGPESIGDLVRATIVVPTEADVQAAVRAVRDNFDVVKVKDRFESPMNTGYRDVLVNVRLPDGTIGEVQIHIPEMLAAKELGHLMYEVQRNLPDGVERTRFVEAQSRFYGGAYESARKRGSGSGQAASSLSKSSRLTGINSSGERSTTPVAADRYPRSGENTTGNPSRSKNEAPGGIGNAGAFINRSPDDSILARAPAGRETSVITEGGDRMRVLYRAVDVGDLVTSHDDALGVNPGFPAELQPRDRTRQASADQINKIANGIVPRLLGESPNAQDGAPIVGRDAVVESGNARTIALRRAYAEGKAEQYREWLIRNAERFGLNPDDIRKMKQPMVVRQGLGEYDRARFARQANQSTVAEMSATERARADAAQLPDLEGLHFDDAGNVDTGASADLVRSFVNNTIGASKRGEVMTSTGELSQTGNTRIRNAVLMKAYGDESLVERIAESLDPGTKNILSGMSRAAPDVAKLQSLADDGARERPTWVPELVEAVRRYGDAREAGQTVAEYLAQGSLIGGEASPSVGALMQQIEAFSRAPKRLADHIRALTRESMKDPRQNELLEPRPTYGKLADDLDQQQVFLQQRATAAGFKSLDEWVASDFDGFMRAADEWRQRNPANELREPARRYDKLFHGTALPFDAFRDGGTSRTGGGYDHQGPAVYLTDDPNGYARFFAKTASFNRSFFDKSLPKEVRDRLVDGDGVVLSVKLADDAKVLELEDAGPEIRALFEKSVGDKDVGRQLRQAVLDRGYDALAFEEPNSPEGWWLKPGARTVAVYRPAKALITGSQPAETLKLKPTDPLLSAQTPADLKAKNEREARAAAADKAEQQRLADKAKADAMRDEFTLTGSDRAADNPNQGSLFERDAPYTVDLFGEPVAPPKPAKPKRVAGLQPPTPRIEAPAGEYATTTAMVTTREQPLGHAGPVKSLGDAAAALAYLNKSAVERLDALVTDKKGKPLAIVGGFKGALTQTSVYPSTLLAESMQVPGAANIWLVHNHPSGAASLSTADEMMSATVAKAFDGTGIKARGILAVTGKRWAGAGQDGERLISRDSGDLKLSEGGSVPAQERQITKGEKLAAPISSPTDAKQLVQKMVSRNMGRPTIVLLDAQNTPIASIPWSPDDALPLKNNGKLDALLRSVSKANAGAALIGTGDPRAGGRTMTTEQAQNLGAALALMDVRALDIIDHQGKSAAELGLNTKSATLRAIGAGAAALGLGLAGIPRDDREQE